MMFRHTLTIHVDFPALSALVDFLQQRQQPQIDAVTAAVSDATKQLKQYTDALQGAIRQEKQ